MTEWVKTPAITVQLNHGKGANVVTGPVCIAFTGNGNAYVGTGDVDPVVVVRGKGYDVSLHFVKQADSTWAEHKHNRAQNVSPRGVMDHWAAAAPTIRAAIIAALVDALAEADTIDVKRQADHANAAQRLHSLEPDRAELAAKLADLDAEIAQHRAVLAETAPKADANANARKYAARFLAETPEGEAHPEPTGEVLSARFADCTIVPKPELYPAIREQIEALKGVK